MAKKAKVVEVKEEPTLSELWRREIAFKCWLKDIPNILDGFISRMPKEVAEKLDFSMESCCLHLTRINLKNLNAILNEIKKRYENEISDIEGIANYTGREAESRGGLKGALEEYARTGKEVGVKHPSNHIQKTENLLKKAKKLERKIKNSTLSANDKQALLNRINQLRQNIEPALNDAIRRRDSK